MKHTPGPWSVSKTNGMIVVHKPGGTVIADVAGDSKMAMSNANLIAAAPEMYEALDKAENELDLAIRKIYGMGINGDVDGYQAIWNVLDQVKSAIAKARGGS